VGLQIPPPENILAIVIVIFLAIGLHEYAHCKMADIAGDPTPRFYGRVTLNLFKHFEPLGTIMMIFTSITGVGIGWGKPSPVNPLRMRNPKWDHFACVAAGPISNLLQAAVWAMLTRILIASGAISLLSSGYLPSKAGAFLPALLVAGVTINLGLFFFNLIPLGPLDGHWLVGTFMPDRLRDKWYHWNRTTGSFVLLFLVILGPAVHLNIFDLLIDAPLMVTFRFLMGI